jgi:hypothetical protein
VAFSADLHLSYVPGVQARQALSFFSTDRLPAWQLGVPKLSRQARS